VQEIIQRSIPKLRDWREKNRPKPHRDDKIMVSWNGLMVRDSFLAIATNRLLRPVSQITTLIQASVSLPAEEYPIVGRCRELAENAVAFIKKEMYDESTGLLVRSWREGKGPVRHFPTRLYARSAK
jgi:uncharacterized protein YyaL (SSP411 family)